MVPAIAKSLIFNDNSPTGRIHYELLLCISTQWYRYTITGIAKVCVMSYIENLLVTEQTWSTCTVDQIIRDLAATLYIIHVSRLD